MNVKLKGREGKTLSIKEESVSRLSPLKQEWFWKVFEKTDDTEVYSSLTILQDAKDEDRIMVIDDNGFGMQAN